MRYETLILGAGAAGLMCAAHSGGKTLVIDHAKNPGEKIRISGGGRCNFTNLHTAPENFLGQNPHFHKSALARYTQWDFIDLMAQHGLAWHEKTLGQLFCDTSAKDIVHLLLAEMRRAGADLWLQTSLRDLTHADGTFTAVLERDGQQSTITAHNLVLATGGKSIPKMGATGLAYDIAGKFGHTLTEIRPALVPLTFSDRRFADLSGTAVTARVKLAGTAFDEAVLLTHRGLSGPAILQISSYWREGDTLDLDLAPDIDLLGTLRAQRRIQGRRAITTELSHHLPAKLVSHLTPELKLSGTLGDQSDATLTALCQHLHHWSLTPTGSEGYRTAEVTLGGIETHAINSQSMMSQNLPGLYIIGEAADVTGWLGGYNFQWAWSSAVAAGRHIDRSFAT